MNQFINSLELEFVDCLLIIFKIFLLQIFSKLLHIFDRSPTKCLCTFVHQMESLESHALQLLFIPFINICMELVYYSNAHYQKTSNYRH
jgi:hypothetical protein